MKIATTVLAIGLVGLACAQMPVPSDIFFTDKLAIGLMPPVIVAQGKPTFAGWSPDGKYLVVSALDGKLTPAMIQAFIQGGGQPQVIPEQAITIFNVERLTSSVVWKGRADQGQVGNISWLPGGQQFAMTLDVPTRNDQGVVTDSRTSIVLVSASNGRMTHLYDAAEDEYASVDCEPSSKGAILVVRRYKKDVKVDDLEARYIWLTKDGRLGNSIVTKGRNSFGQILWTQNGAKPILISNRPSPDTGKPTLAWFDFDFPNGQLRPTAPQKIEHPQIEEPDFRLLQGGTKTGAADKQISLKAAFLVAKEKGPHQSALVAAEVEDMSLSPARNAVYYTTKGIAMVRQLFPMPKELALKALEAAERASLLSDVKQVGLGFMMYASDFDDVLPGNSGDWQGMLNPYLQNGMLTNGFFYTFGGGNLADIENPAGTEIGYKQGPGGRAVVYADGHAKWIPDK